MSLTEQEKEYFAKIKNNAAGFYSATQERGYRNIWSLISAGMYSSEAHFLYELLQNADDAKATECVFHLYDDRLVFAHNGNIFSITDPDDESLWGNLNAICAIGDSSKDALERNTIGKFGIGFKSVFKITDCPHIYCKGKMTYGFRLDNFIIPTEIEADFESFDLKVAEKWQEAVVFVLPFKNNSRDTIDLILDGFGKFDYPILFLNHLKLLRWKYQDNEDSHSIDVTDESAEMQIRLQHGAYVRDNARQEIYKFSSDFKGYPCSVCFLSDGSRIIAPQTTTCAYCFFPTKQETHLKFLVHAPFYLTPNREFLREGDKDEDEDHRKMIRKLAKIAVQAFGYFQKAGLYTEDLFREGIVPFNNDFWKNGDLFGAFYNETLECFRKQPMFPAKNGGFVRGAEACWGPNDMESLFSDEQISELQYQNSCKKWIFASISDRDNSPLRNFATRLGVRILERKTFIDSICEKDNERRLADFISQQSTEWLKDFYKYIKSDSRYKFIPIFLDKNKKAASLFVRLENNDCQILFVPEEGNHELKMGDFNSILPDLYTYDETQNLVKELGGCNPVGMLQQIEASFDSHRWGKACSVEEYIRNILPLLDKAWQELDENDKVLLLAKLKHARIPLLCSCEQDRQKIILSDRYEEIYEYSEDFGAYLILADACFVEKSRYNEDFIANFLPEISISTYPKQEKVTVASQPDHDVLGWKRKLDIIEEQFKVNLDTFRNARGRSHECCYYRPMGIEQVLAQFGNRVDAEDKRKISNQIWKVLIQIARGAREGQKMMKLYHRFSFRGENQSPSVDINDGLSLYSVPWLLDKSGGYHTPDDIDSSKIDFGFYRADAVEQTIIMDLFHIQRCEAGGADEEAPEVLRFKDLPIAQRTQMFKLWDEHVQRESERRQRETERQQRLQAARANRQRTVKSREWASDAPVLAPIPPLSHEEDSDSDLQTEFDRLQKEYAKKRESLERAATLKQVANDNERYTFGWFRSMLAWEDEALSTTGTETTKFSLLFQRIEKEGDILTLSHPDKETIPPRIESLEVLELSLYKSDRSSARLNVGSFQIESGLRLKVRAKDVRELEALGDIKQYVQVMVTAQDVKFLFKELRDAINQLPQREDDACLLSSLPGKDNLRFVYGPPGTGKTTKIAGELLSAMRHASERKILVLTPTNKAADVLVSRIISLMGHDDSFTEWLVRFGTSLGADERIYYDKAKSIRGKKKYVMVTTLARFPYDKFNDGLSIKEIAWDSVYFDEASMMHLSSVLYPVLKIGPTCHYVVAGDPKQIGPIAQVSEWAEENIYTLYGLQDFREYDNMNVERLMTQHRSQSTIGSLYSRFAYNGELKNDTEIAPIPMNSPLQKISTEAISIVDFSVNENDSLLKARRCHGSAYHVYSAILAYNMAYHYAELLKEDECSRSIGIISPYKIQAKIVDDLILHGNPMPENVIVHADTIHGFQGDECDVIIVLLNPPPSFPNCPSYSFVNRENILNVAISRAKSRLIILCPEGVKASLNNLYRLLHLAHGAAKISSADEVEEAIFSNSCYIEANTFCCGHDNVNVYCDRRYLYEVHCDELAIDIQVMKEEE